MKSASRLRQALGADLDALAVWNIVDDGWEPKTGISQHPAERTIRMVDADLAIQWLEHRDSARAGFDRGLQRFNLRPVASVQNGKSRLRAGQFSQHPVDMRRAVLRIVDGDGRGDLLQFFDWCRSVRFRQDEIGLEGDDRFQIGVDGAYIGDVAIVEIDTGQNGAGAQIGFAVPTHAAMATHRHHTQFYQRDGEIDVVQGDDTFRL